MPSHHTDDRGRPLPYVARAEVFKQLWGDAGVPTRLKLYQLIGPAAGFAGFLYYFTNNAWLLGGKAGPGTTAWFMIAASLSISAFTYWSRGGRRFQAISQSSPAQQSNSPLIWTASFAIVIGLAILALVRAHSTSASPGSAAAFRVYDIACVVMVLSFSASMIGSIRAIRRQKCDEKGLQLQYDKDLLRLGFVLNPLMLAAGAALFEGFDTKGTGSLTHALTFAGGGLLCGVLLSLMKLAASRSKKTPAPTYGNGRLSAWLAAHDHCGACGYSLAEVPAEPDGVRICPECGAAWHKDRVTRPLPTPDNKSGVIEALTRVEGLVLDDRGVPLPRKVRTLGGWVKEMRPLGHGAAVLQETHRIMRAARIRKALIFGVGAWCAIAATLFLFGGQVAHDRGLMTWSLSLIAIAIFVVSFFYIEHAHTPAELCETILETGLCPGCCMSLEKAIDRGVAYDGCIACRECGLAWKRVKVSVAGSPPLPEGV